MKSAIENRWDALFDLADVLSRQSDFQEILRLVTQKASDLINADVAVIMMINPKTRHTLKTIHREGKNADEQKIHFIQTNVSGWVIDNKASFVTSNLQKDKRFRNNLFKGFPVQSVACVPLKTECVIIGTLLLISPNKSPYSDRDLLFLEKLAILVSPVLKNVQRVEQYFTSPVAKENLLRKYEVHGLLGKSEKFVELLQSIEAAAHCDVRVLLEGKSGTGKELVARAIHGFSDRADRSFVAIDSGAISPHLMESELFGHVKGAFTGATTARKGLFEEAHTGTLFMDEITNLPLDLQAKLLRVLQENEVRPIGSNTTRTVDVRIIAATSRSLKEMVEQETFREDLYYRLLVYPIHIPSLQEREEDIPILANHFMRIFSRQQNKAIEHFHEEVVDFMKARSWPGNIRELENFIERVVILAPKECKQITAKMLPSELQEEIKRVKKSQKMSVSLTESLAEFEASLIRNALEENRWNQSRAARALGISEQTMRYKMHKLKIRKE